VQQLHQSGAYDGQVPTWDDDLGIWIPATPAGGGGGGGSGYDRRWNPGSGETSVDEFDNDSIGGSWVQVDASGGASRAVWTEGGDSLSVVNTGTDANGELHALLISVGTSLSTGDAFITCLSQMGSPNTNYSFSGLMLSDGTTHGSGSQALAAAWLGTTPVYRQRVETRAHTLFTTSGTATTTLDVPPGVPTYLRLVMTAANTWRADVSPDGVSWANGTTVSLTMTPTHVGLFTSTWSANVRHVTSFEFVRRVSGVS
jgi:hypothetical protein